MTRAAMQEARYLAPVYLTSRDGLWSAMTVTQLLLDAENRNLSRDLATAALYDTPAHRERQLAIWAERERRALLREIAW